VRIVQGVVGRASDAYQEDSVIEVNWWFDFGIDPTDPADWPLMSLIAQERGK
jgi:hypothetical protein